MLRNRSEKTHELNEKPYPRDREEIVLFVCCVTLNLCGIFMFVWTNQLGIICEKLVWFKYTQTNVYISLKRKICTIQDPRSIAVFHLCSYKCSYGLNVWWRRKVRGIPGDVWAVCNLCVVFCVYYFDYILINTHVLNENRNIMVPDFIRGQTVPRCVWCVCSICVCGLYAFGGFGFVFVCGDTFVKCNASGDRPTYLRVSLYLRVVTIRASPSCNKRRREKAHVRIAIAFQITQTPNRWVEMSRGRYSYTLAARWCKHKTAWILQTERGAWVVRIMQSKMGHVSLAFTRAQHSNRPVNTHIIFNSIIT